jgi:serine protease Do
MRGFGEIAERLRHHCVQVFAEDRTRGGSGVVWGADGLILTNAHVARMANAKVELWDCRRFDARVVARDTSRDLAALRIPVTGLETATPGDSHTLRPGELVMAIGNPLGFVGALSLGVVHSIGKIPGMGRHAWIRADVRLAPGNSGGLLANAQGEVVGINTAIINGLGVAATTSSVVDFLRLGSPPELGVTLRPLRSGLLVLEVKPGGAAAAASLLPGDVLLSTMDNLNALLDERPSVARLQFLRGNRGPLRETFVRLSARAAEAA